jgi:hypothetical protein
VQKVFDTFSAIVQLPLLICVTHDQRHGRLEKQRLREFREAEKAMEKAQEQETKNLLREAKRAENEELTLKGGGR